MNRVYELKQENLELRREIAALKKDQENKLKDSYNNGFVAGQIRFLNAVEERFKDISKK